MKKKPDNSNKPGVKTIKSKDVKDPDDGGLTKEELYQIPEDIREKIFEIQTASFYQGTLPPPENIERYEKVLPGTFREILDITKDNAKHRREIDTVSIELEKKYLEEDINLRKKGQDRAFWVVFLGLIIVALCAYLGESTIGSILAGTTLIILVPQFVSGIKNKNVKSDKEQKQT
jgi:uncharacterized membrane protein